MTMFFAKKLNKKGFTLAELLIVVAIIAVLIAIAVPIFTNSLEKARYGVHSSNGRAMKSLAVAELLGSDEFASQNFKDDNLYVAYGSYNFATEEMKLFKISDYNDAGGTGAGMWMSQTEINHNSIEPDLKIPANYMKFVPNNDGYNTIGRVGTGTKTGTVYYIIVFSSTDISDLEIKFGS